MNPISIGGEIKITIDISDRLQQILEAFTGGLGVAVSAAPQQPVTSQTPPPQATAVPVEQPPVQAAPHASAVPTAVPTSAPTYQLDDLSNAAAGLLDQNPANMQVLQELTARYGVQTLAGLPAERYGAFATDLRALGAKI